MPPGVLTGQQGVPGRRTHGGRAVAIRVAHPRGGKAVEVRRLHLRGPVARQVPVADVVGENDHHVGRSAVAGGRGIGPREGEDNDEEAAEEGHIGLPAEDCGRTGCGVVYPTVPGLNSLDKSFLPTLPRPPPCPPAWPSSCFL